VDHELTYGKNGTPEVIAEVIRGFQAMQNKGEVLTDFQYRFFVAMHEQAKGLAE